MHDSHALFGTHRLTALGLMRNAAANSVTVNKPEVSLIVSLL